MVAFGSVATAVNAGPSSAAVDAVKSLPEESVLPSVTMSGADKA